MAAIGGDFMEFRFALPTMLVLVIALDVVSRDALLGWLRRPRALSLVALPIALVWALLCLDVRPLGYGEMRWHLSAEDEHYRVTSLRPLRVESDLFARGSGLGEALEDTGVAPRLATCCIGMLGYYGHVPISDAYALINPRVARRSIERHDRPGHEKRATREELLEDGAQLADWPEWAGYEDATRVTVGAVELWLLRHVPELETLARARGWDYPDLEASVSARLGEPPEQLRASRAFFDRFLEGTALHDRLVARLDAELASR